MASHKIAQNSPSSQDLIDTPTAKEPIWRNFIGIILGFISTIIFPIQTVIVRNFNNNSYNPINIALWRFPSLLIPSIPMMMYAFCYKKKPVLNAEGKKQMSLTMMTFLLCVRGIFGATAVIMQFHSLEYISAADSLVITFSSPVFVMFVAHFLLKEKCGIVPTVAAIFTLIGITVITRPPFLTGSDSFDMKTLIGSGFAFLSMMATIVVFISVRYLRNVHHSVLMFTLGAWGLVECLILGLCISGLELPHGQKDWTYLLIMSLASFFGQLCFTLALKYEQASLVSIIRSCDVIFGFLWQYVFFTVLPDGISIAGAFIVIFGVGIIGFRKLLMEFPDGHKARRTFRFLLL